MYGLREVWNEFVSYTWDVLRFTKKTLITRITIIGVL